MITGLRFRKNLSGTYFVPSEIEFTEEEVKFILKALKEARTKEDNKKAKSL